MSAVGLVKSILNLGAEPGVLESLLALNLCKLDELGDLDLLLPIGDSTSNLIAPYFGLAFGLSYYDY